MDTERTGGERESHGAPPGEPRIGPMEVAEFTDDMRQFLVHMSQLAHALLAEDRAEAVGYTPGVSAMQLGDPAPLLAVMPELLRTMLHHPRLFTSLTDIAIQLMGDGALSPRERELAVLRIGWLCQAPYEWGEHVMVAKKAGITSEEIERITEGSQASGWSEHERAILRATEELHANATISDGTWEALSRRFNTRQLIELPVLVGQYQVTAYFQNSLRVRLLDGNEGLEAR